MLLALATGCGSGGGGGFFAPSTSGSTASPATISSGVSPIATATAPLNGDEDVCPLVLVHGINGSPNDWNTVIDGLASGRTVYGEAYADDLAALAPGSLPRSIAFAVGYYKTSASDAPYYGGRGSIGGCPFARNDGNQDYYGVSYIDVLDECIESILKATGSDRVDLVGMSMGTIVTRAYIYWRSGRGPNGQSRVRRYIILASPGRGLDDLEAFALCMANDQFQRWGEIAEMSHDYPGWQGESYNAHLNDGWDAWCQAHGVSYGGLYGSGHYIENTTTINLALSAIHNYIPAVPSSIGAVGSGLPTNPLAPPPPPLPAPLSTSSGQPSPAPPGPALPTDQGTLLQTLAQAGVFVSASTNWGQCLTDLVSDGDGFIRASCANLAAGPEFPNRQFNAEFLGFHLFQGQVEECIQDSTNSRELIRRFAIEGRLPVAPVVSASLVAVPSVQGRAGWLELLYEVSGGDGVSLQVFTEDPTQYALRNLIPDYPDVHTVYGDPTFQGAHVLRLDEPAQGQRVGTLVFYDVNGIAAQLGPFDYQLEAGGPGDISPVTTYVGFAPASFGGTVTVASNASGAEFSSHLVKIGDPAGAGAYGPWSSSAAVVLPALSTGSYELFVASRHAANAAGIAVEESNPLVLGLRVDGSGNVTLTP